ncbi:MAG: DUF892 family protein [Flavobacterium sp.]|nr:DUF892 family protein [Flavobacterium sp.]
MENAKKSEENFPEKKENEIHAVKPKLDGEAGLRELMLQELRSMYYVEKVVSKSFAKIIKNACNYELIEAIYIHQQDTQKQVLRIEESFELLNEKVLLAHSNSIDSMIAELESMIENTKFGMIRDAGIILALHKIEHFEIASYTILTLYAENLKENTIFELLDKSLNEEKVAQMRLAKIANTIKFYPAT